MPGAEWFTEEVRQELIQQFGQDVTTQGGLMVRTSLDPALQIAAEKSLRDGLMAYDRKHGRLARAGDASDAYAPGAIVKRTGPPALARGRGRRACCRTGNWAWC